MTPSSNNPQQPKPARLPWRWIVGTAVALLVVVGGVITLQYWANHTWVYSDGDTIAQPIANATPGEILFQPPEKLAEALNLPIDVYEPRLSWDGNTLYFVRGRPGENADLFVTERSPRGWSDPQPLAALNTPDDELGPAPTFDNQRLYFYSNRADGLGGYDLWFADRTENGWTEPQNLGGLVNSSFNDYGPAPSPDGTVLYFASNRPGPDAHPEDAENAWSATLREDFDKRTYDLYRAQVSAAGHSEAFAIDELNTVYNEGAPCPSPVGDFLYFASDRPGGVGGFDLYRVRMLRGHLQQPTALPRPVNTRANELDPALAQLGYALTFSSNRDAIEGVAPPVPYQLFHTTAREVFRERGPSEPLLAQLPPGWWLNLLWLLLALLALLALLRLWQMDSGRRLSLLAKCLLASLMAHLLLMLLFNFWEVSAGLADLLRRSGNQVTLVSAAPADALTQQVRGDLTAPAAELNVPEITTAGAAADVAPELPFARPVEITVARPAAPAAEAIPVREQLPVWAEPPASTSQLRPPALPQDSLAEVALPDVPRAIRSDAAEPAITEVPAAPALEATVFTPPMPVAPQADAFAGLGIALPTNSSVATNATDTFVEQAAPPVAHAEPHDAAHNTAPSAPALADVSLPAADVPLQLPRPASKNAPTKSEAVDSPRPVALEAATPGAVAPSAPAVPVQQTPPLASAPTAPPRESLAARTPPPTSDPAAAAPAPAAPSVHSPLDVSSERAQVAVALPDASPPTPAHKPNENATDAPTPPTEFAPSHIARDLPAVLDPDRLQAAPRRALQARPAPELPRSLAGQAASRPEIGRGEAAPDLAQTTTPPPINAALNLPPDFADGFRLPGAAPSAEERITEAAQQRGVIFGIVSDEETGRPLTNAVVRLDQEAGEPLLVPVDEDGFFVLAAPELPDYFALSAGAPDYVPSSENVSSERLEDSAVRVDFSLAPESETYIIADAVPQVHHLGNNRFNGRINSQFQRESEGERLFAQFPVPASQFPLQSVELRLMAKGVQCPHPVRINGREIADTLPNSPRDGSFGEVVLQIDPELFSPGINSLEITTASCSGDIDDYEFVNVQLHFERLGGAERATAE